MVDQYTVRGDDQVLIVWIVRISIIEDDFPFFVHKVLKAVAGRIEKYVILIVVFVGFINEHLVFDHFEADIVRDLFACFQAERRVFLADLDQLFGIFRDRLMEIPPSIVDAVDGIRLIV